jgi:hypothetical protein
MSFLAHGLFKTKWFPGSSVKKFKAQFCARGDRQKEGINFFEAWAPVVQWSTIPIVMVLAAKLCLQLIHCDITAAFIHGHVPLEEEIYLHQPRGFKQGKGTEVLCLWRTLYGLCQLPQYFYKYFTEHLVMQGLTPSNFDPYLFLSSTLIVVIYVDDIFIYGREEKEIDNFIARMKTEDMALHKEGTAEGYLGGDIQRHENQITFMQIGLTKHLIDALGLDSKYTTAVATPA